MENRKQMYKAGPRDNPTLTDRVKDNKNRGKDARMNKFAATRKISVSPGTPSKASTNISEITDRNKKLRAYRVAKNTKKFIEMQEQRSPFIVAVPTGRWLEKKERPPVVNFRLNDTPVRAALASERVLKKSTMKQLIAKSAAKKENAMVAQKGKAKLTAEKSKKQILAELNAVSQNKEIPDLNDTFEVLPELPDSPVDPNPLRRSVSLPQISSPPKAAAELQKTTTPPIKKAVRKEPMKKMVLEPVAKTKPVVKAAVKRLASKPLPAKPVPIKTTAKAIAKKVEVKEKAPKVEAKKPAFVKKNIAAAVIKKPVAKPQKQTTEAKSFLVADLPVESVPEVVEAKRATRVFRHNVPEEEPNRSQTYNTFNQAISIQSNYLSMQISNITDNMQAYIELLSDDDQTFLHKTVQQGNLIVSDKLPKFSKLLEKFEEGLKDQSNPKQLTDDDVEDYWYLLYNEIDRLKEDITTVLDKKKSALAVVASQKKRRTRRTYIPDEGTPKRSRRIAENADTPKHNASCYGCVTMSATKVNTPKSTNKRRTTNKKSVLFDVVAETPKRSSRRSSKKVIATPKHKLNHMDAVEDDDLDLELNLM